ncbi:MAG TPA: c-type cytochrome [Thauera aminoaromatica]|jgi:cytochrome c5|uniref:Cytochrome c class I n=1 Tax=Thauera aminoaromatica TaxID=164330 RepID=C4ZMK1_THASP|nr:MULTISPECIES: c-type cytochrome [Thauera]MDA0235548.1 c-type cytochrome [Pseudomonadota bacterium]OPZ03744.1 MAG: Cytochrome c-555 precursor [Alphaproteobacteria bacterium ADurb.BinA305]TMW76950.1 cytochrome c5 family protein [Thauera sp. UPWRP]ACK53045.1 cytochrome c class I [Thauera aminoaromatica]MBP6131507.1 cytochrome c5 family protein [Thauera sp.]
MSNPRPLRPARLAMPVALVAAALLAGCGDSGKVDEELRATLIQPVARVEIQAVTITPGTRTGEQIYKSICAACHDAGAVGAPKTGDAAAWGPRLALGHDGLTASAIAGKNAMPPRGGGSDLTDTEVKRAVAYLANLAGAGYTEPPVEQ